MEENNMNQNNIEQSNTSPNNKPKKPIYKRPWFIVIAAIFAFSIIDGALTDSDKKSVDNSSVVAEADIKSLIEKETSPPTEKPTEVKTEPPTEKPTEKPTGAEIEEEEEGFIDSLKDKAGGIVDKFKDKSEEVMDSVKDKSSEFLIDNDDGTDDFIYDGKEEMMGFGIQYKENVLIDGNKVTVYLDDDKLFEIESGQGNMVFMPIDDKKHEVRIENNILHLGTKRQTFNYDELISFGDFLYTEFEITFSPMKLAPYSLEKSDNSSDNIYDIAIYWYENGEIEELLNSKNFFE